MLLKKVIITAMKEEWDKIISRFNMEEVHSSKTFTVYEGKRTNTWEEEEIVLIVAWIGKIAAAMGASYAFENYQVEKLINIWIAGLVKTEDYKVWDVFLPNTIVQHDMYLPFEGDHLDYAKKPIFLDYAVDKNYDLNKFGLIMNGICVTGDQFVDTEEKSKELLENFDADVCEMEAFAILSVARENEALDKCVVIKAVSDWADNEAKDAHMDNLDFAMENSIQVLELIL